MGKAPYEWLIMCKVLFVNLFYERRKQSTLQKESMKAGQRQLKRQSTLVIYNPSIINGGE